MEPIITYAHHRYWWADLCRPDEFRAPAPGTPFTCLLWDTIGTWLAADRLALVERVLASGCRFVVCGGQTCERWHDDFDEVLAVRDAKSREAGPLVMTTWHTGEPVEDVAEFFVLHAKPPEGGVLEHLVLQIGPEWDLRNDLVVCVRDWVVRPKEIAAREADARGAAG